MGWGGGGPLGGVGLPLFSSASVATLKNCGVVVGVGDGAPLRV